VEVPDLVSAVRAGIRSNFYHPHPNHFDEFRLARLLSHHGWSVCHQQLVPVFGGSLFVVAMPEGVTPPSMSPPLPAPALEPGELERFVAGWRGWCTETRAFFNEIAEGQGHTIDGHGAAERTAATIGMCGLDSSHVRRLYDRNPAFHGRAIPGPRILIFPVEAIEESTPDVLVIFAQSFEEEIVADLRRRGLGPMRFVSLRGERPHFLDPEAAQ
jgi:hypothetical protein